MTPATFSQRWASAVSEVGDRNFLIFCALDGTTTSFTYAQMDALVAQVAGRLAGAGVRSGSSVHLVLGNSPAFIAAWLACSRLGAWMVPADPSAAVNELSRQIERVLPSAAVCSNSRASDYHQAVEASGHSVGVFAVDEADTELDELRAAPVPRYAAEPKTRLGLLFTSGTTAEPKGVEITQANYAFTGDVMAGAAALSRYDRQLIVLPMFHANAQYYSVASAISVGASVALVQRFSASQFVSQARGLEATHASLFAAPIRMILARTPPGSTPLQLQHAWFAQSLSSVQFEAISALLGCRPRQLYGMTETAPAVLSNPIVGSRELSIGQPTLGCHVRLTSISGNAAARVGEVGRIEVGGYPGTTLFAGYLDNPEATDASIVERRDDGFIWFATGDRATIDDGFYYFQGRSAETLKIGGENVSLAEIELVMGEHPDVHEVAVIGVDDPIHDEVPHAFVVLSEGAEAITIEHLRAFAAERLSKFKRPRSIELVDELPRTSVGKIRKFLLTPSVSGDDTPVQNQGDQP